MEVIGCVREGWWSADGRLYGQRDRPRLEARGPRDRMRTVQRSETRITERWVALGLLTVSIHPN